MAVIPFPDRRPWRLRCPLVEMAVELEVARRELCYARGLPPGPPRLRLAEPG